MTLRLGIEPGNAREGLLITVYDEDNSLKYTIRGQYGGFELSIEQNGECVASVSEVFHQFKKSDFCLEMLSDGQKSVTFKPNGRLSSGWSVNVDGSKWEITGSNRHKVSCGGAAIGVVESSTLSPGANTVTANEIEHELALVGFATALYLRDLRARPQMGMGNLFIAV